MAMGRSTTSELHILGSLPLTLVQITKTCTAVGSAMFEH